MTKQTKKKTNWALVVEMEKAIQRYWKRRGKKIDKMLVAMFTRSFETKYRKR